MPIKIIFRSNLLFSTTFDHTSFIFFVPLNIITRMLLLVGIYSTFKLQKYVFQIVLCLEYAFVVHIKITLVFLILSAKTIVKRT